MPLVDRRAEQRELGGLLERGPPALALLTGRRRVGKTFLLSIEALVGGGSPLCGRFDCQHTLEPFTYWYAPELAPFESLMDRALAYGVFGGTPTYLAAIDARRTPAEPGPTRRSSRMPPYTTSRQAASRRRSGPRSRRANGGRSSDRSRMCTRPKQQLLRDHEEIAPARHTVTARPPRAGTRATHAPSRRGCRSSPCAPPRESSRSATRERATRTTV